MSQKDQLARAQAWFRRARPWILGVILILAVLAIPLLPERVWTASSFSYFDTERLERLKPLGQILAALVVLIGLIAAVQRIKVTDKQAEAAHRQAATAEQGQITDRFTRAIEQLGKPEEADHLVARLGGIHSLERIAADSERDHWAVMEVLCAFLRESFSYRRDEDAEEIQASPHFKSAPIVKPAEVKAVCKVLNRRRERPEPEGLDLQHTDLRGADLRDARLSKADLRHAGLIDAILSRANLFNASLESAVMIGADLAQADLRFANLQKADFRKARLIRAKLEGAIVSNTSLQNAIFYEADLHLVDLDGADLSSADLRRSLRLTQDQLDSAEGDAETRLPGNLKRPDHWKK